MLGTCENFGKLTDYIFQIELQYVAQAATIAEESLSSVRTAKAFAIEQRLVDLYDESNRETTKQGKKKAVIQGEW